MLHVAKKIVINNKQIKQNNNFFLPDKSVELVSGGSVINGAILSSLKNLCFLFKFGLYSHKEAPYNTHRLKPSTKHITQKDAYKDNIHPIASYKYNTNTVASHKVGNTQRCLAQSRSLTK